MSEKLKVDYMRLINYVDAASNLAEGIAADIKSSKSPSISNETVVNLAKFYRAARNVQELRDMVETDKTRIN